MKRDLPGGVSLLATLVSRRAALVTAISFGMLGTLAPLDAAASKLTSHSSGPGIAVLDDVVSELRSRLGLTSLSEGPATDSPPSRLAQWYNWGNWPNWPNYWGNWPNWANW